MHQYLSDENVLLIKIDINKIKFFNFYLFKYLNRMQQQQQQKKTQPKSKIRDR